MADNLVFYTKASVPNKWALQDVLYWVAMQLIPESHFREGDHEAREDVDVFLENPFELGDYFGDVLFENDETEKFGLRPDPRWEEINSEHSLSTEQNLFMSKLLFEDKEVMAENEKKYLALAEESKKYEKRLFEWQVKFDDFLDKHISRLLIDLAESKLVGEGIFIRGEFIEDSKDDIADNIYREISSQTVYENAFKIVPNALWVRRRVDWRGGLIQSDTDIILGIRFNRDDVLEIYPPNSNQEELTYVCGNGLLKKGHDLSVNVKVKNRGRPQKNWEKIHIKIAEIISKNGGLPAKQDALAEEINSWYLATFKQPIGLSTIKSRLKPYYDNQIFKKSEK